MSQQGKVAFITGGARGLGKAFAEALLEGGAKVSLADIIVEQGRITEKEFKDKYGANNVIFNKCDVTNMEDLRACYRKTLDTFGGLDIVINNAGISDENSFEKMVDINLTAVIRSSYLAANIMNKEKGGRGGIIINIASSSGIYPSHYILSYSATKHAVIGFSRSMAMNVKDTRRFGLRVVALCPTFADTDMTKPKNLLAAWTRPADLTMPNLEESSQKLLEGRNSLGLMQPKRVVDGMLEVLSEPDSNGAVLLMSPMRTKYKFPKKLANKL